MALFDNNPLYENISSLTNPVTSGLGNLFGGMNVFGARLPDYLSGVPAQGQAPAVPGLLNPAQQEQLKNQALLSGLIGTAATYFAQPKNQNIGLGAILGKSYLGGMQASQGAYNTATENEMNKLKIQKEQRDALLDFQKAIPNDIREYEYAVKQGYGGTFNQYAKEMANLKAPKTSVVTNVANKEFASNVIKDLEGSLTAGYDAQSTLPTISSMKNLITEGVRTGTGAETAKIISKAGQLLVPGFNVESTSKLEQFDALSKGVIIPQVKKLGANPTNTDLQFIVDSAPGIGKTPEGNLLLLNVLEIGAKRDAELASWTADWQLKNASLIENNSSQARAKLFKDKLAFTKDLQARTAPDVLAIKSQLPGLVQSNTGVIKNKNILFK
jgi:hypothetical protein